MRVVFTLKTVSIYAQYIPFNVRTADSPDKGHFSWPTDYPKKGTTHETREKHPKMSVLLQDHLMHRGDSHVLRCYRLPNQWNERYIDGTPEKHPKMSVLLEAHPIQYAGKSWQKHAFLFLYQEWYDMVRSFLFFVTTGSRGRPQSVRKWYTDTLVTKKKKSAVKVVASPVDSQQRVWAHMFINFVYAEEVIHIISYGTTHDLRCSFTCTHIIQLMIHGDPFLVHTIQLVIYGAPFLVHTSHIIQLMIPVPLFSDTYHTPRDLRCPYSCTHNIQLMIHRARFLVHASCDSWFTVPIFLYTHLGSYPLG